MAYRCQSCGLFAGLDEPDLAAQEPEFEGDTVTVAIDATYPSQCCADTVAEASYEATADVEPEHHKDCAAKAAGDAQYTLEAGEPSATDRFQTTDARGKPIPARYQRHYYGVEVEVAITCDDCGEKTEVVCADEQGPPDEA
jgi:hypothetical protein